MGYHKFIPTFNVKIGNQPFYYCLSGEERATKPFVNIDWAWESLKKSHKIETGTRFNLI